MDLVDRRTGKLVTVPDDQAQAAFKSGMYGIPKGAAMPVARPGMVGTVDASQAQQAIDQGMRVAAAPEIQAAQMENRYGGVGGTVGAVGAGALRGAGEAFGLPTDKVVGDLGDLLSGDIMHGGDAIRERLRAYQTLHPYASMGGEMAGIVGATLATGGETLLGNVGGLAERAVPGALGNVGRGVVRNAAEGSLLGGISTINESALGPSDLTGEKLVAGMGHGALFGAALGGAFSGLGVAKNVIRDEGGRWLGRLRPADVESLAEKTFGHAPEGLGDRVQKFYAKAAAGASGKDAEVIGKLTDLSPEGAEARRIAVFDAPKIQEEAQRAIREQVDNMLRSGDLVTAEARGALKADYVAKAVKTGNEADTAAHMRGTLAKLIDGAESELTHADGFAPQMTKSLETVSRAAYRAMDALESGSNAKMFVELDSLKRSVQKLTKAGTRSVRNIADPLDQMAARRTVDWMRGAAEDVRTGLEDESLWGKAATDQREINGAWSKQLDASERFHRALTTETVRDPENPYQRLRGADPGRVESYVRNLTNPNNDLTHQAVKDYVESSRELADAIHKSYELPPEKAAEVARVRSAAEGFGSTIDKAEKSLVLANQYRALTEGSSDSISGLLGMVGLAGAGPIGGAIGTAVGTLTNPGRTVAQLAAVERMITKVDAKIGSSLRGFVKGRGGAVKPRELPEAATPDGFERTRKTLAQSVDPDGNVTPWATKQIANSMGDLADVAPQLATSASMTSMRIQSYLHNKLPVAMENPFDLFGNEKPLVSDSEREAFGRRVAVAKDPTTVFEHLERGDVTPEETEALKNCYPEMYADAGQQLDALIIEQKAKGKNLDYQRTVELGVLFERRTDATLDPAVMSMVAMARVGGGRGRKGGGSGGAPAGAGFVRPVKGLGSKMMTTFEAAASRRKGGL